MLTYKHSFLQSDTMEWMQGMIMQSLISLFVTILSDNHCYHQPIPSPWEWGQPFQHAGWYGGQHDPTAGWLDGYAGHGYARHGELPESYFVKIMITIGRVGWEVACQWTIPSSPQCGVACLADPWAWAGGWWRCVMYNVHFEKGHRLTLRINCPWISFWNVGFTMSGQN